LAATERLLQISGLAGKGLELRIEVDRDGIARLTRLSARDPGGAPGAQALARDASLPLLDVVVSGEGRGWSGGRYCESEAGSRFRYTGHSERPTDGSWSELRVDLDDPVTGLHAEVF
jgi:hypothetical protein